ncbi:MAG: trimethylamine methyltransferase family protein [Deltaproteobacteria bacterium]|nr:trimethylamine methyltransferase family protein [Deltaproteobacteria bacterium]
MGQGLVGSPAALVMNAEIISYVRRIIKGFDIDPEHIGMDVIREVGPQGAFIATEQTMKFFKQEHWQPGLCNRTNPDLWEKMGSKTWGDNAVQKALDILNNHKPAPLPKEIQETIDAIRVSALTDLDGKQFEA